MKSTAMLAKVRRYRKALRQIVSTKRADGRYEKHDAAGCIAIAERALVDE